LANPVVAHIRRCPVLPSASPLQGAHHFPGWRPAKYFGAGNIGASLHADWAANWHGARRGINVDWYAALPALAAHHLDLISLGGWHSAQCLAFPNLRQGTYEDFRGSVHLPCAANITRHAGGKNGNPASEARCLRSADFAFDQRLACSDEDWHSGLPDLLYQ
jgi:hypothetical protein